MVRTLISLAPVLLLASACATSSAPAGASALKAQSSATPQAGTAAVAAEDQKLICEMERPVGSNIPKRVCRTKAQMDREREAAQDKMRELQQGHQKSSN